MMMTIMIGNKKVSKRRVVNRSPLFCLIGVFFLTFFVTGSALAQNITAKVYRPNGSDGNYYGKMHIPMGKKYRIAMFPKSGTTVGVFRSHIDGQNIYLSSVDPYGNTFWIDATEVEQNFLVRSSDGTDVVAIPVTAAEDAAMVDNEWYYFEASDAKRNRLKYATVTIPNKTLRENTTYAGKPIYVMANPLNHGLAFIRLDQVNSTRDLVAGSLYLVGKAGTGVRQLNIVFENDIETETSGINDVPTLGPRQADDACYSLQGVRVEKPVKGGLYIRNGRKYVAE